MYHYLNDPDSVKEFYSVLVIDSEQLREQLRGQNLQNSIKLAPSSFFRSPRTDLNRQPADYKLIRRAKYNILYFKENQVVKQF